MTDLVFATYIITNFKMGTLYTGHTDNLPQRMEQHVHGIFEGFSKTHKLKHLVWYELHETRDAAFKRERRIKDWNRQWKIDMIERENPFWIDLHTVSVWPLPDVALFPDLYKTCLEHRVDPGLRRGERGYE